MTSLPNILLTPASALYRAAVRTRLILYRRGLLTTRSVPAPVISVGNITTGGTGKTPLVSWLASHLANSGERVCILTRGHGRTNMSQQVLVSDGSRLLAEAPEAGDEPRLLAEDLLGGAAVVSNANRFEAAHWAIENLRSSVFILDDGFQHIALARDLNIVTIDSMQPWGGGMLPRGHLREPLQCLERADVILLTRSNLVQQIDLIRSEGQRLSKGKPVFLSQTRTKRLRPMSLHGRTSDVDNITAPPIQPISAFCALGNPDAFFSQLVADGHTIVNTKSFRDHHKYTQSDIDQLNQEAIARGAKALVTTTKDEVKLRSLDFKLPCYVLEIELVIENEPALIEIVNNSIKAFRSR